MARKKKKHAAIKETETGHFCQPDPLAEVEESQETELTGRMHDLAEKPTKLPKKTRSGGRESYYPMRGGRR